MHRAGRAVPVVAGSVARVVTLLFTVAAVNMSAPANISNNKCRHHKLDRVKNNHQPSHASRSPAAASSKWSASLAVASQSSMGGGVSKPFSKPAEPRLPSERTFSNAGAAVHLVGTVAAVDGKVLSSPFGAHQGPAIEITALRRSLYDGGDQKLFRAYSALDFYITDGSSKIRVLKRACQTAQ